MAKAGTIEGRMRVAVVDDDSDTRLFFRDILQSEPGFSFAGGFSSAGEALKSIPLLQPDLVLMDANLPGMDGIECAKRLMQAVLRLNVVIVSGNRETNSFERSLQAGASAYLIKPMDPAQLLATLRFVASHVNEHAGMAPRKSEKAIHSILSQRERAVLSKLAEGLLYKEISDVLGISYTAVRKSQHRIFQKLKVSNRSEVTRLWLGNKAA
jgi:DNA-binding NarL/FixJ family response regulator